MDNRQVALRVLLTCKYLPPEVEGGGALTVRALANALVAANVDVTILKAVPPANAHKATVDGVRLVETPYRDRFDYRARGYPDFYGQLAAKRFNHASYRMAIRQLVSSQQFDVIHAQNHTTALAAAALRDETRLPLVATLRGHGLWCFVLGKCLPDGSVCSGCVTPNQIPCLGAPSIARQPTVLPALALMKAWMRKQEKLARRIDLMLPISTLMADEARSYGREMRIIPDLVADRDDTAPLPPEVAEALARARRTPQTRVALYAGRLAPNKGCGLVVDAAALRPDWSFVIAGDDARGGYRRELEQRVAERGVHNVTLVGWVPNASMPALYDAVDVVLLPFLRPEPLSRGMVEALSRGRALAATAHGGPLDGVDDGVNGVLFEPTAEALAQALDRLDAMDPVALGAASRRIYNERFHPDEVVKKHLEAYEWVVNSAGGRRDR